MLVLPELLSGQKLSGLLFYVREFKAVSSWKELWCLKVE